MEAFDYLERLHKTELLLLDEIVRLCEKHGLRYCIVAGTLLGAVRHGGFIPWDDDLDIAMPRFDLERFIEICKTELSEQFYIQSTYTDERYFRPFAKLRMTNTLFLEKGCVEAGEDFHNGIFVDIFPLDNARKKTGFQRLQKRIVMKLTAMMQSKLGIVSLSRSKRLIAELCSFGMLQGLQRFVMKCAPKDSAYYVNLSSQYSVDKQTMKKSVYFPASAVIFEGKSYAAPCEVKTYLNSIYGADYMQLPPVEKRRTHKPIDICFDLKARAAGEKE